MKEMKENKKKKRAYINNMIINKGICNFTSK